MNQNSLQQLIDHLRADGNSDEQLADFLTKLSEDVAQTLYLDAFSSFSDQDLEAIKAAPSPEEKNNQIRTRYTAILGKDPSERAKELYQTVAQKFLDEVQRSKSSPQSQQPLSSPNP